MSVLVAIVRANVWHRLVALCGQMKVGRQTNELNPLAR